MGTKTYQMTKTAFQEDAIHDMQVFRWLLCAKDKHTSAESDKCSGCSTQWQSSFC
jgi:hypothetical protein